MTNSLQDLIDASIFISTEYQARLAELVVPPSGMWISLPSLWIFDSLPALAHSAFWALNLRTAVLGFGLGSSWATFPTPLFLPLFRLVKQVSVTAWLS